MKSDHWNFLANLLGAPGAAEPPAQPPKPAPPSKKEDKPAALSSPIEVEKAARPVDAAVPASVQPNHPVAPQTTSNSNDPLGFSSFRDLDDEPVVKKEPAERTPTHREPTPSAERSSPDRHVRPSETAPVAKPRESAFATDSESVSGDDVLQALTAVTPPPRLPGFGVSNEPAVVEPAKKEPSMWGRIAGKFGVGGERKPELEGENSQERPRATVPSPVSERPSAGPTRSGFGGGLIDADDDDNLPVKGFRDSPPAESDAGDDDFGRPRRGSSRRDSSTRDSSTRDSSTRDAGQRDSELDTSGGRERTRRSIARTGDDEASESPEVLPLPDAGKDEPSGRPSRRRGRRGIRQRISEDDLDRPEVVPAAGDDKSRDDQTRDSGRRHEIRSSGTTEREGSARRAGSSRAEGSSREVSSSRDTESTRDSSSSRRDANEGRGRGRTRDREPTAERDRGPRGGRGSSRHRDDADLPPHDDAFVGDDSPIEMDGDFDDIDDDGFGSGLAGEVRDEVNGDVDATDEESARGPRSRSRRRGRRGRRRGGSESTTPAARVEPDDLDDDELGDDDEMIVEAAFDDDHEDDEEVEEIRRGSRRRSRSRSRRPARSENGSVTAELPGKGTDAKASRDAGSLDVEFVDLDAAADSDGSRRRSSAPTWLETVELLVNANIENHNRGGSKSQRGGRGGNSGGRRR